MPAWGGEGTVMEGHQSSLAVADPGGRKRRVPPPPGKYFKKSPLLAKIYKKILGASPQNPGRPPFFRSWIRHCLGQSQGSAYSMSLVGKITCCGSWGGGNANFENKKDDNMII